MPGPWKRSSLEGRYIVLCQSVEWRALAGSPAKTFDTAARRVQLPAMRVPGLLLIVLLLLHADPSVAAESRFFTTTDGVRLHYLEAGPPGADTILFVPGWTMPAWIWSRQMEAFAATRHVIAFDPRGQGASDIPRSGYDPLRRGRDLGELIDRLGPRPVLMVAWSLGVLDTLAYIHSSGDHRIAGLVLVDNSVGENPAPVAPPAASAPRPPHESFLRRFVPAMFHVPQTAAWLDRLIAACLRMPEAAARSLLAYPVPRTYWREAVYSTGKPILYVVRPRLAGQAENLVKNHRSAESVTFDTAGHALFVDEPGRFNAVLADFIRRRIWP